MTSEKIVKTNVPFLNSDHSIASMSFSYRSIKNENDCLAMYDGETLKIIDPMTSRSRRIDKDTKKEIVFILAELLASANSNNDTFTTSNDSAPATENATTTTSYIKKEVHPMTKEEELAEESAAVDFYTKASFSSPIINQIIGEDNKGRSQRIYSYCKRVLSSVLPAVELLPMATTSASGYYGRTSIYMFGAIPVYKISLSRKVLNNSTILQAMTTCCHEFAHLTYWDHNAGHTTLTKKYLEIVTNSLGGE